VGGGKKAAAAAEKRRASGQSLEVDDRRFVELLWSTSLVIALVIGVLTGIWQGFFTPTEGAGVGAAAGLLLAMIKGMRAKEIYEAVLNVGRTCAPLLLLLFCAQLYSRVLSMTGITNAVKDLFLNSGLSQFEVLGIMLLVWFVLGCLIDSISIILITVPVFAPVAAAVGFDPLAFAVLGIIAIETGLLTPPFGILVFTVKAALPEDDGLTIGDIFRGAIPYWIALLVAIAIIAFFPQIATYLPELGSPSGK
jgi:TRAP-type C4-dicarboxylate transport system permease large subunit